VNIVFWGTPEYSVPTLNQLFQSKHKIVAVVTQPDKRRKRGKALYPSPIKERARELGLKVLTPINIKNDIITTKELFELNADVYIVVAFGQILPLEILEHPAYGSWNAHASLLPRWRGAAPIQRCLLNGDTKTGVCIMYMEQGLDTGPILNQEEILIPKNTNSLILSNKLSLLSANSIVKSLELIEKSGKGTKKERLKRLNVINQESINKKSSYANIITKEEYLIDWNLSACEINSKVNAFYPNSYSYATDKRIKLLETEVLQFADLRYKRYKLLSSRYNSLINGQIISDQTTSTIIIKTNDFPIVIKSAQIEGRKEAVDNNLYQQIKSLNCSHLSNKITSTS
tara:strand:+ start:562 stop:1590 length:1029 start_codon:yes stop_codon:yes gene_type:complete